MRSNRTTKVWLLGAAICAALVSAPAPASAQSDSAKIAAARKIGFAGVKDYQAGKYAEASDKLERAYALVNAPTLGLWSGRALMKTGKWVAAAERFLEATRLPLPETNRANHEKAKKEAAQERQQLLPKIPNLVVNVTGAPASEVQLTIDGVAIDSALIGIAQPIDPGSHSVVATWKGQEQKRDVQLAEAGKESIELKFDPSAAAPAPVPAPGTGPATSPPPTTPPPSGGGSDATVDTGDGGSSNTLAYVALGVGGAGLIAGTITGVIALGKKSDLEDSGFCSGDKCGPQAHDDVDSLNSMRTISTIGFVVGAVGVGAGLTLLLTGGEEKAAARTTDIYVGPSSVRFRGSF